MYRKPCVFMPILIILTIVVLIIIILLILYFHYNNCEIALRKQADAQLGKIKSTFDKTWKVISQKTQVADEYRKAFEQIYPKLIGGRYQETKNEVMRWINEDNPEFKEEVYLDLMNSIESLRSEFKHSQDRILDIIREHTTLCESYPAKWFITHKTPIEYQVISSTYTEDVLEKGKEDDVHLNF